MNDNVSVIQAVNHSSPLRFPMKAQSQINFIIGANAMQTPAPEDETTYRENTYYRPLQKDLGKMFNMGNSSAFQSPRI